MKYSMITFLLCLAACSIEPISKDWAIAAATVYANSMGESHPAVTCETYDYRKRAWCSVKIDSNIIPLYCQRGDQCVQEVK